MKQQMLKSLSSLMVLLVMLEALTGCVHRISHSNGTTVGLIIHGPFLIVVEEGVIRVLMQKGGDHELSFPYPVPHEAKLPDGCKNTTEFVLQGVESARQSRIDPEFGPVIFAIPDWEKQQTVKKEGLLVTMSLPVPVSINALGPFYGVRFAADPGKVEWVPSTFILRFMARDLSKVRLVRRCVAEESSNEQSMRPVSCNDLQNKYEDYFQAIDDPGFEESQRPYLRQELHRCADNSALFVVGAGLHPHSFWELKNNPRARHELFAKSGRDFFNGQILPLVFGEAVPQGKRLVSEEQPQQNQPNRNPGKLYGATWPSPGIVPAVYRVATPQFVPTLYRSSLPPRLSAVPAAMLASTENCTAPGAIVTTH